MKNKSTQATATKAVKTGSNGAVSQDEYRTLSISDQGTARLRVPNRLLADLGITEGGQEVVFRRNANGPGWIITKARAKSKK